MTNRIVFTPLENGNIQSSGSEQIVNDIRETINYCDALMKINANHNPYYTVAIGGLTFIDNSSSNILDFILTFHSKDENIYLFEWAKHIDALEDHMQYLKENDLLKD